MFLDKTESGLITLNHMAFKYIIGVPLFTICTIFNVFFPYFPSKIKETRGGLRLLHSIVLFGMQVIPLSHLWSVTGGAFAFAHSRVRTWQPRGNMKLDFVWI